jgi:alkylhydroperoxidase/carboxymuconolactone decarboxylase family protein YurZ
MKVAARPTKILTKEMINLNFITELYTQLFSKHKHTEVNPLLVQVNDQPKSTNQSLNGKEETIMTPQEANAYMQEKMHFLPRMFATVNQIAPPAGKTFADFYSVIMGDGALPGKVKELMFMSTGVAYCSPRCIIHVIPAIEAGATDAEIFEAAAVGMTAAGFVPGGPGIPYAFEYAAKCVDIAAKYRAGEDWEYLPAPQFNRGVY